MKAGSAGSSPDGVNLEENLHSQPVQTLLRDIGGAVFILNTTVVGLDAVENGHKKPETLNVSWQPLDRKIAARKSRKFILESVLVRVSEVINEFVLALSKLPRFEASRKAWEQDASSADKVSIVATTLLEKNDYLIPGVVLVVHWRNRIVHSISKAKLLHHQVRVLTKNKETIAARYRGLNVSKLLDDFHDQRPTLKDVSSLISMTINLARKIDRNMQGNLNKDELDAWLNHYGLVPMLEKVKAETSPEKRRASACRLIRSEAPLLLDAYLSYYDPNASLAIE